MTTWIIGITGSLILALGAWRLKALSLSGSIAAIAVGSIIYGIGSWPWALPLITFFVSASLLSKWRKSEKEKLDDSNESRRDLGQVLANGGIPTALALVFALQPDGAVLLAYAAAIACANADTWATEIGSLSKAAPRLIHNFKAASPGQSGAISLQGSIASFAGAILIGLSAMLMIEEKSWQALLIISSAGFAGSLVDSLLGATIQHQKRCVKCQTLTEADKHCETVTESRRGLPFIGNNAVNALATISAAVIAWLWAMQL